MTIERIAAPVGTEVKRSAAWMPIADQRRGARDEDLAEAGARGRGRRAPGGRADPGRGGDQQRAERPGRVEQAAFDVGPVGRLQQVGDVGDPEDEEPRAEDEPAAVEAEAVERRRRRDQRQQHHVADRIGEVGGVGEGRAGARPGVEDRAEDERRGEGGDCGADDDPVEPLGGAEVPLSSPHQDDQARVGDRVEEQVAGVGGGGDGDRARVGERDLVIDFARRPDRQRRAEQEPGGPLRADRPRPQQAGAGGAEHQRVVEPVGEGAVDRRAAEPGRRVGGEGEEGDAEEPGAGPDQAFGSGIRFGGHRFPSTGLHRSQSPCIRAYEE